MMWQRHVLGIACVVLAGMLGCNRTAVRPANNMAIPGIIPSQSAAEPPKAVGMFSQSAKRTDKPKALQTETMRLLAEMRSDAAEVAMQQPEERQAMLKSSDEYYQKVLQQSPDHTGATRGLARLKDQMNDTAASQELYQQMIQKNPKDGALWLEFAMTKARREDYTTACDILRQGMEHDPQNVTLKKTMGFLLAKAGRIDEGCQWLTQVMPEADARMNLAGLMMSTNQPQIARQQIELVIQSNPTRADALAMRDDIIGVRKPTAADLENSIVTASPVSPLTPSRLAPETIQHAGHLQAMPGNAPVVVPALHQQPAVNPGIPTMISSLPPLNSVPLTTDQSALPETLPTGKPMP